MVERKSRSNRIGIVAIVGATATGKTSLGIELALRLNGEIVNADSRLFYRGMDIGTAKPTQNERRGVEHHLINILDPWSAFSLSDFLREARAAIADIEKRGKLPIIVGGSGQYIWGLLEGWEVPEIPPNLGLRNELETQLRDEGIESLQRRLESTRAKNVDKVEILNPRRLVRAIERAVATGDAMGGASKAVEPPYDALVIGLTAPRELLHERVAQRVDQMFASGWKDEVEHLMESGVKSELPSMSAIGYRQLVEHINGDTTWETVREQVLIGNHRLIGQQHNWFKPRDNRIGWVDITGDDYSENVMSSVRSWILARGQTGLER